MSSIIPEKSKDQNAVSDLRKEAEVLSKYLHHRIVPNHIQKNGLLLDDDELRFIRQYIKENPEQKKIFRTREKTDLKHPERSEPLVVQSPPGTLEKLKFSVIVLNDKGKLIPFALYTGKMHALGKGSSGEVILGQNLDTGEWVAIKKQVQSSKISDETFMERHRKEANINTLLGQGKGMLVREKETEEKDEQGRKIYRQQGYIILELGKGDALEYYEAAENEGQPIPLSDALEVSLSVSENLENYHKMGLLHRDIKPDNILIDPIAGKARLIDHGFVVELNKEDTKNKTDSKGNIIKVYENDTVVGSPGYRAPEVLQEPSEYSSKSDIYALGMAFKKRLLGTWTLGSHPEIEALIDAMTAEDPNTRPEIKEVIENIKAIQQKLKADPTYSQAPSDEEQIKGFFEKMQVVVNNYQTASPAVKNKGQEALYQELAQFIEKYKNDTLRIVDIGDVLFSIDEYHFINQRKEFFNDNRYNSELKDCAFYLTKIDKKIVDMISTKILPGTLKP